MTLHEDAVGLLRRWPGDGGTGDDLRDAYLEHLDAHADGVYRECVPGHLTASAVILDDAGERVLLTLHGKLGMWLQTGGHCEPGDATVAGAALREASEESGIEGLRLLPGPVTLDRHWVGCHGGAWHYDVQYAAVAPAGARTAISEESRDLRWFPVSALPDSADVSVRRLVDRATALVHTPGGPR